MANVNWGLYLVMRTSNSFAGRFGCASRSDSLHYDWRNILAALSALFIAYPGITAIMYGETK